MGRFSDLKLALAQLEEAQSHYAGILAHTFHVGDNVQWRVSGHLQIGKVTGRANYSPEFGTRIKVKNIHTGKEYLIQLGQVFEAED